MDEDMQQDRDGRGETFILGAGFSKAICDVMPTLAELGDAVVARLPRDRITLMSPSAGRAVAAGKVPGGNLERWLSYLSEPPPYLSTSERQYNLGLFYELTAFIESEIEERQSEALLRPLPVWLARLVRLWHVAKAVVISYNYDQLVECTLQALDIVGSHGQLDLDALDGIPSSPSRPGTWGPSSRVPTLRLLKLHGSTDWQWSPQDVTGESIVRPSLQAAWGSRRDDRSEQRLPGKEPFIIPPLATKSRFYELGLVRELWQRAREALQRTRAVTISGYSFPLADFASALLIGLETQGDVAWSIADMDPEPVSERIGQIVSHKSEVNVFSGARAISDMVDAFELRVAEATAHSLPSVMSGPSIDSNWAVMVRSSRSLTADAIDIKRAGADLEIRCKSPMPLERWQVDPAAKLTVGEMLQAVNKPTQAGLRRIVAVTTRGESRVVLGATPDRHAASGRDVLMLEIQTDGPQDAATLRFTD